MTIENPFDESRRRLLVRALSLGVLGVGTATQRAWSQQLTALPGPMPQGRSIYQLDGTATVNGSAASIDTVIKPGDEVSTGDRSQLIFVVDTDEIGRAHV